MSSDQLGKTTLQTVLYRTGYSYWQVDTICQNFPAHTAGHHTFQRPIFVIPNFSSTCESRVETCTGGSLPEIRRYHLL